MTTLTARGIRAVQAEPTAAADISVQLHSHDTASAVITGELDLATARRVTETVMDVIDQGGRHIVMDLSGLTCCDSQGLSAFVRMAGHAEAAGGGITLTGVRPGMARLLRITGLDHRFAVGSSLDCAAPAA